jgi:hypothetical protein
MVDRRLIQDTLGMLRQQIDPDTAIRLADDVHLLERLAAVVEKTGLHKHRKMTILGGYLLLQQAVLKHQDVLEGQNDVLTRSILDGDYLMGAYYKLLSQHQELDLLSHLAPVYKKLQLSLLMGRPVKRAMREVYAAFREYLDQADREAMTS